LVGASFEGEGGRKGGRSRKEEGSVGVDVRDGAGVGGVACSFFRHRGNGGEDVKEVVVHRCRCFGRK
jgi:hypothetical protein